MFFQAEDGIRDLVRSRGLGDVYKRQLLDSITKETSRFAEDLEREVYRFAVAVAERIVKPVSYTHLTLPTSDLV